MENKIDPMNKIKPNGRRFMRRVAVGFTTGRRRRRKRIMSPRACGRTLISLTEKEGWLVKKTRKEFILNLIPEATIGGRGRWLVRYTDVND